MAAVNAPYRRSSRARPRGTLAASSAHSRTKYSLNPSRGWSRTVPARVPTDEVRLEGTARHAVPVTILSGGMDDAAFREAIAQWGPYGAEFDAIADAEVVALGSGHWPQFSQPERLSSALIAAVR